MLNFMEIDRSLHESFIPIGGFGGKKKKAPAKGPAVRAPAKKKKKVKKFKARPMPKFYTKNRAEARGGAAAE